MPENALYSIKDPEDYVGGFVATGIVAIIQTITPLLLGQLWKKNDIKMSGHNPWIAYAWKAMQAGGVVSYGLLALGFLGAFIYDFNILERLGMIGLWITHGMMFSHLSFITTIMNNHHINHHHH